MIFYPTRELVVTPDQAGLPFENANIAVATNDTLHGWYFNSPDSTKDQSEQRVVLFCHGNGGNISHRLETAQFLQELGASLLMFDYRGYGQSSGQHSETNLHEDAFACYQWLIDEKGWRPEQIVLFGRSLGGAVVVELASKARTAGIIVESSFTSIGDMGSRMFPWLPVRYLLKYDFASIDKISNLNCPVLVTHSPDDSMIPFEMGRELYEAAGEKARFVELEGDHNDLSYFQIDEYRAAVRSIVSP